MGYYDTSTSSEMDKKIAEEILGFEPSTDYTHSDMTAKYHNTVAKKASVEYDEDELRKVDHARAYLESYFVEDPNVTLTSESNIQDSSSTSSSYGTYSWENSVSLTGKFIDSLDDAYDQFAPTSLSYLYSRAHAKAARKLGYNKNFKYNIPELTGDYPLWFQAIYGIIIRFPWRFAFLILIGFGSLSGIWTADLTDGTENMFSIVGDGLWKMIESLFVITLVGINCITGFLTNLMRKALAFIADFLLEKQIDATAIRSLKKQFGKADKQSKASNQKNHENQKEEIEEKSVSTEQSITSR